MGSQRWLVMVIVLMVGTVVGCNVFWEGASASSQISEGDAQDVGDTSSDDGAIREDGPDVLTGDATSPVDRGPDVTPPEDRFESDTLADVLDATSLGSDGGDTGETGEDAIFVDVQDESLAPVDIPVGQDVVDAGSASDVPQDATLSMDVVPVLDHGQDVGVSDAGFDTGSPDVGIDGGPTCPMGQMLCGGACVSTASNVDHCGACGNACPASPFPNMVRACQGGQCASVCSAGFANCDSLMGNGCEVDTRSSAQHCGACGRVCSLANATSVCLAGACYVAGCSMGFANCDMTEANGCEADTRSNVQHCGACGRVCTPVENGAVSCLNGACVTTCREGAFLEGGACVLRDIVLEYRHWSMDMTVTAPNNDGLLSDPDGLRFGLAEDVFRPRVCDTRPVRFERGGVSWWRCLVLRGPVSGSVSRIVVAPKNGCGTGYLPSSCPSRWREQWRLIFRGRVYDHPQDTDRFTTHGACPYTGWDGGCVEVRLSP